MYLEFLLWRHQLWGSQQCVRRRSSHKTCFSNANSLTFIRKHGSCCLYFKEIFQRITSSEGILHLPNEVSCLWSLQAPDVRDDSFACISNVQVLIELPRLMSEFGCQRGQWWQCWENDPAWSSWDRGRVTEHAKCDLWDNPLKEMENRVRAGRGSGSSEDAQNKAGSASFWKHWHCLSEAPFSTYCYSLPHTCTQWVRQQCQKKKPK